VFVTFSSGNQIVATTSLLTRHCNIGGNSCASTTSMKTSNVSSLGKPVRDLVKCLITGYLPKSGFHEKWKASERRKTKTKKISPTDKEEGLQENIPELWSNFIAARKFS
jgi:hypothetical protein